MTGYLVQHYYDQSAAVFPNQCAIKCGGESLTYQELNVYANRLCNRLVSLNVKRQDRIVICLSRTAFTIVAIAGVLKADAIYVPVDPNIPADRLSSILTDCRPSVLVCDMATMNKLEKHKTIDAIPDIVLVLVSGNKKNRAVREKGFIDYDFLGETSSQLSKYKNIDTDIAYILYTSGSTGKPKGVMVTHLNIMNYIEWAVSCFEINYKEIILNTAPFHFDMSTFDMFCAAKSGAQLTIATGNQLLFPTKLIELIESDKITIWKAVSSLLMYLAKTRSIKEGQMPSLHTILFAGEVFATKYLMEWMRIFPEKQYVNAYGPTEATGISLYHRIKETPKSIDDIIPIGKVCKNTDAFLLTKNGQLLSEDDKIGELAIRGSGVASGYWNNKKLTDDVFVKFDLTGNPNERMFVTGDLCKKRKDGLFEYVGRKDRQIKYRGYRIELGEIEKALINVSTISDAAVVLVNSKNFDIPELIAYIENENRDNDVSLKKMVSNTLPHYMIPDVFINVDTIPRNDRGKVNYPFLIENHEKYLSGV